MKHVLVLGQVSQTLNPRGAVILTFHICKTVPNFKKKHQIGPISSNRSLFLPKLAFVMIVLQNAMCKVFSFEGICKPSSFQLGRDLTLTPRHFMISLELLTVFVSQLDPFVIGGV